MRSLMLLRHAETESVRPGSPDHERRLTPDGERTASEVGDYVRRAHGEVDLILCSSATRTQQTAAALGAGAPVVLSDELYNAGGEQILALVRELEDGVQRVVVVGHAPGLPWAAHSLADPETSDAQALAAIEYRYPAGTLSVLAVDGGWADLERAALVAVRLP